MTLQDAPAQGSASADLTGEPQVAPQASQGTPESQVAPSEPSAPAPQPVVFAGRQFASQSEAERYFEHTLQSAAGRVRALKEQNAKLQTPPTPTTPQPEKQPFDREVYAELHRTYGADKAEAYRLEETQKFERARLQQTIDERLRPIEEANQQAQLEARTTELFSRAKTVADPATGQLLFPEFSHDEAAAAIVNIWQELHPEQAVTPAGIRIAVDIYRGRVARGMSRATPPAPARPAPSGQSVAPQSSGQGFAPGTAPTSQHSVTNVPRSVRVDPVTGERYI